VNDNDDDDRYQIHFYYFGEHVMCHAFMLAGSQYKRMTYSYTNCCIYRVVPPDDEQQACSKHVEVNY